MFDAGSAVGKLGLDLSDYARGMLQAQSIASLFPSVVTNFLANPLLGLIGIAKDAASAIADAFTSIGSAADDAGEAAQKVGVSVEFLTGVGTAAADAGSSVQGLGDAMKFLNNNAADAAAGNKTVRQAFADLGVSFADSSGKLRDGEAIFFDLADAMANIEDPARRTQAAMNLMGRGGTDLIPLMQQGSAGIREFAATIEGLGGTIDGDLAAAGDKFGTLTTIVDAAMQGAKRSLAEPILTFVAEHFEEIVGTIEELSGQLRPFLASVGEQVAAMLPGLLEFGGVVLNGIAGAFQVLAPIVSSTFTVLGGLARVVEAVLVPAFKLLQPVLETVARLLDMIMKVVGPVINGVASVINTVMGPLGAGGGGGVAGAPKGDTNVTVHVQADRGQDLVEAVARKLRRVEQERSAERGRSIVRENL